MRPEDNSEKWFEVIAKSLASLCLAQTELKGTLERALYLQGLGLERADAAQVIGTTSESIRVLEHQAKRKNGAKTNGNKKGKRRGSRQ